MYSQSFSEKELYRYVWQTERRNMHLNQDSFGQLFHKETGDFLKTGIFPFSFEKDCEFYLNAQKSRETSLCQNVVMRKLAQNIRKIYAIRQSDRNLIVRQIISLLKESGNCFVVRMDVKSFYETVNVGNILKKFHEAGRLSAQSVSLLDQIFNCPGISMSNGLPRGLSISALMSEFYMRHFDLNIKRMPGVYYYARFVDDIIVFCQSENSRNAIWDEARKALGELGLSLNLLKSFRWDSSCEKPIVYLGYSFTKKGDDVEVRIAPKKVNKIKTRIVRTLFQYRKKKNEDLLISRIKYLTGNCRIKNTELKSMYAGIYYNYRLITCTDQLLELDNFMDNLLYGNKLVFLPNATKVKLHKYKFSMGFKKKIRHRFSGKEIKKIKSCWRCD